MKIYLAGPITGLEELNLPEFRKFEKKLLDKNFEVIVPHDLFKDIDTSEFLWEDYMKVCLPAMMECDKVITLNNWNKSRGTRLEVHVARELDMSVLPISRFL